MSILTPRIPYAEQLAEVRREVAMRERVYPKFILDGTLTQARASQRIDTMRAVAETLVELASSEPVMTPEPPRAA